MIRLAGTLKPYQWGSRSVMHDFLGWPADGEPCAELWFGAHPAGPSAVVGGRAPDLAAHIAADPAATLGPRRDERPELPFLLKLLAPGEPVSLQVHPSSAMARAGFADEQRRGVHPDAPHRIFADESSKPEMLYALTAFDGLAGFRSPDAIRATLALLPDAGGLRQAAAGVSAGETWARVLAAALAVTPEDLRRLVAAARSARGESAIATFIELAEAYPGDAGALAGLILERHRLEPGDALPVPAGTPHSYLSGLAVEVMANSDTVIRGGLTQKHVDVERFIACVDLVETQPSPWRAPVTPMPIRTLAPAAAPFCLTVVEATGTVIAIPGDGPRIALAVDGQVRLRSAAGAERSAARGEAFFVDAADGELAVSGSGTLVVASAEPSRGAKEIA